MTTVGIFRGQLPATQEKESSSQAGEPSDAPPCPTSLPSILFPPGPGLLVLRSFHVLRASLPVAALKGGWLHSPLGFHHGCVFL